MKKTFLLFALFVTAFAQNTFTQDSTRNQAWPLLTSYYNLKDALIGSNPAVAAANAAEFLKAVESVDKETINEESRKVLLSDAEAISQTKDLKVQREKFATLSTAMIVLAKAVKLSPEPVYQQYCPMKKASWLSNEKAIKNPYYGSAMLTCGSVKDTF